MHVYLRDEPVRLQMRRVDGEGLVPDESDLVPVAFFVDGQQQPSFRALLPLDTVAVLDEALEEPVTLGVLAEEPEDPSAEIHAMVGLAIPVDGADLDEEEEEEEPSEPWLRNAGDPEAWRGDSYEEEEEGSRTALLAFAPLVRLVRKFPHDFGEELSDLLESALSGATRPALEARIDRMLGDL